MNAEQFCYWLQGRAELMPDTPPSDTEWKMIAEHLATVFHKVTPPLLRTEKPIDPATVQDMLARRQTVPFDLAARCATTPADMRGVASWQC
jgi:hypothetical protein